MLYDILFIRNLAHFADSIYSVLIFATSVKMGFLLCFLIAVHWQFIKYWRLV